MAHSVSTPYSLLEGLRQKDPMAWAQVCTLYGPLIEDWCKSFGVSKEERGDIAQNVLVAVIQHGASFRKENPQDRFCKWLWAVTRNAVAAYRKSAGKVTFIPPEQLLLHPDGNGELNDPPISHDIQIQMISAAAAMVEEKEKKVMWEIFMESLGGLATEEIAKRYGISAGNVRVIRFRILAKIKDLLELTDEAETEAGDESGDID